MIKKFLANQILFGTAIVATASLVGSVFSYLLQILLGNLLTIEDFGTFNAFLSMSVLLAAPAGAVSASLVKTVSELLAKNNMGALRAVFKKFSLGGLAAGLVLASLFLLLQKFAMDFLNIENKGLILLFTAYLTTAFVGFIPASFLQGLLRFKAFAFFSVSAQFLRLTFPVCLVLLGMRVGGVFAGMALMTLVMYFVGFVLLRKNFTTKPENADTRELTKTLLLFSIPVMFSTLSMGLLNNVDVILVKHFFTDYETGVYSGALAMVKVLLFGAISVQTVMFPIIANEVARGGRYFAKLGQFFILQIAVLFVGLGVFTIFPNLINKIMFAGKYTDSVHLLPLFAVFASLYVLCNFLVVFLLALSKTKVAILLAPYIGVQAALIYRSHETLTQVLHANIIAGGLIVLSLGLYVFKEYRAQRAGTFSNLA